MRNVKDLLPFSGKRNMSVPESKRRMREVGKDSGLTEDDIDFALGKLSFDELCEGEDEPYHAFRDCVYAVRSVLGAETTWKMMKDWTQGSKKSWLNRLQSLAFSNNERIEGLTKVRIGTLFMYLEKYNPEAHKELQAAIAARTGKGKPPSQMLVSDLAAEMDIYRADLTVKEWRKWDSMLWQRDKTEEFSVSDDIKEIYRTLPMGDSVGTSIVNQTAEMLSRCKGVRANLAAVFDEKPHLFGMKERKYNWDLEKNEKIESVREHYVSRFTSYMPVNHYEGLPLLMEKIVDTQFKKKERKQATKVLRWLIREALWGEWNHALFVFAQGDVGTGKSLLAKAIFQLLGDYTTGGYAMTISTDRMTSTDNVALEWLMPMLTARFIWGDEFKSEKARINSALTSALAQGHPVHGRQHYGNTAALPTKALLWFTSNKRPIMDESTLKDKLLLIAMNKRVVRNTKLEKRLLNTKNMEKLMHWALMIDETEAGVSADALRKRPKLPKSWREDTAAYFGLDGNTVRTYAKLNIETDTSYKVGKDELKEAIREYDPQCADMSDADIVAELKAALPQVTFRETTIRIDGVTKHAWRGLRIRERKGLSL